MSLSRRGILGLFAAGAAMPVLAKMPLSDPIPAAQAVTGFGRVALKEEGSLVAYDTMSHAADALAYAMPPTHPMSAVLWPGVKDWFAKQPKATYEDCFDDGFSEIGIDFAAPPSKA